MIIAALCFSMALIFATNTGKTVKADEPALNTTKFSVSTSGDYMLLVTPITGGVADIYEVGFDFTGTEPTLVQHETTIYYTSINGKGAHTLFGGTYTDSTPMIVWEVVNDGKITDATSCTAYIKIGERVGDVLYPNVGDTKTQGTARYLTTEMFTVTSGHGTVTRDQYPAHAEEDLRGVTGTKLISTDTSATFTYNSTVRLNEGDDNILARFMTTNDIMPAGQGKYEVNYVTFHFTDSVAGHTLSVSIRSVPFVDEPGIDDPCSYWVVFVDGTYYGMGHDHYVTNFSNVTKDDTAWRAIPQIELNTTTGQVAYAGVYIFQSNLLIGFGGTNEISVSVELNLKETGNGIVIQMLCNQRQP